ncbi:TPA: 1-(5-phosphoribosyl)-5-[(5-phosphoribosylamino)methylideneamino]imidazole-4-carboxamide isomerase [Candidatus Poribacteria bacterium]|nr:1-(5-phosphoribosyl)-5-[(5-phosphoribosylamino)methylideneamino]imidazole-4-carboxamide isomerase [Candidatus Poribacteria bacterium]
MIVIPAIDLMDGKCVRLKRGRFDSKTIFSDDPIEVALRWQEMGAEWIHVVDLDGAREGTMRNFDVVERIVRSVEISVQLGGGIRGMRRLRTVLDLGVERAIIGTAALKNPQFAKLACEEFGDRIAVGIDARDGMVATNGWLDVTEKPAIQFAVEMERLGVPLIIYTDIGRDGTLSGVNVKAIEEMARAINIPLIASGGVSSMDDIEKLREIEHLGLIGVIVGKALYTGDLDLKEAIERAGD